MSLSLGVVGYALRALLAWAEASVIVLLCVLEVKAAKTRRTAPVTLATNSDRESTSRFQLLPRVFSIPAMSSGVTPSWRRSFAGVEDRKSTRLNSSHTVISYAVFCLKKKKK